MQIPANQPVRLCFLLGVAITQCAGCQTTETLKNRLAGFAAARSQQNLADLKDDLVQFMEYVESEITAAANHIEANAEDRRVRKAAVLWKVELANEFVETLSEDEPMPMLFDAWSLCIRMREYFGKGDGKALFGSQQPIAVSTAQISLKRIEAVARDHLPEEKLQEIARQIEAYARAHPIRGLFVHEAEEEFSRGGVGKAVLNLLFGVPLQAIDKISEGLDPTLRLAQAVDRFTALMQDYPLLVRWQAQLLMLQLEESASLRGAVAGIEKVSESSVSLAATAERLPEDLGEQMHKLLDGIDAQQPELRKTLRDTRDTLVLMNETLERAENVSATIERSLGEVSKSGEIWQGTAAEVTQTIKQIQKFGKPRGGVGQTVPEPPSGEQAASEQSNPSRFDINDYRRTAEALTITARELRDMLSEVETLIDGDLPAGKPSPLGTVSAEILGQTSETAREIVDHITWRATQVLAVLLVLALTYRFATRRRPRAERHDP